MPISAGKPKERPDKDKIEKNKRRQAPGKTLDARENQLISLAVDLAEKQIKNGTASAQVLTHYLKLGSSQALLEKAKLDKENQLLQAKTEALKSQKKVEEMIESALLAMRTYTGQGNIQDD